MCGLPAITTRCPRQSRASRRVHDSVGRRGHGLLSHRKVSSVILRAWRMHPLARSLIRARGFAQIVSMRARWNRAAGPSFCSASYPAAIPDSQNTRGCRCFPAPDTGKTRSMLIGSSIDFLPGTSYGAGSWSRLFGGFLRQPRYFSGGQGRGFTFLGCLPIGPFGTRG